MVSTSPWQVQLVPLFIKKMVFEWYLLQNNLYGMKTISLDQFRMVW